MNVKKQITKRKNEYNWTNSDKQRAVATYISVGSFSKASAITGIPENTIRYWSKQEWFDEEARRVDKADTDELKSTFTRIAKRASSELEDRLDNGDEVITKDGEIIRKKIGGRDLAIISAVAADKRKQQMETPVTVAVQSSQEKLLSLMENFIRFANSKEIKQENANVQEIPSMDQESIPEAPEQPTSAAASGPGTTPTI